MAYWLVKSEPSSWSFEDHLALGTRSEPWDSVRNHQAQSFMRNMKIGDLAFFYHSIVGKEIVGIIRVTREWYPDPQDETGKFGLVDFVVVEPLAIPVTLKQIKEDASLKGLYLVRQSRLSVMPIPDEAAKKIRSLGGLSPKL